ncbi:hypothetical protein BDF22DRAFT_360220 [Syncephalis plumigaleata]|nr:hypothetical protein BDF22DRAFT_360220 [Syncephalis plumigaleata]
MYTLNYNSFTLLFLLIILLSRRALYNCIQWHDTASLFKLTMYRLKALHFMRDYLARAIPRHSAEFLSSCVYISFLMSTIYHREMNDESRWRKVAEVFDRCRNSSSSLLFFKDLVDPVSLRFNVNLSRRTLSHHFTRDLVDSCSKSIPTQPSLPAAASEPIISNDNQSTSLIPNVLLAENASIVAVKQALCGILVNSNFPNFNLVHHMKLEDDNDFPRILTRHADASYTNWCCCHNLFACFSLDNDNLIKNFVNLLLDEYLRTRRDNTWDSYLVDGVTKDDLLAFSHNLFKHNNLFTYLLKSKVDIIAFKKHIIWFQNLLPSPERIRQDYAAFKRRSPWLRLQYRAFYIRLVHKNPDVDFGNFTDRCLDYLVANDYRYFPKSDASSKLWYNSSKGLQFHRIPTSAELAEFRQQNVNSI